MGAFLKSVSWGALAGSLPYLLLSVPFGFGAGVMKLLEGDSDALLAPLLMALPLLIALPITAATLLLVGLPLSYLLQRLDREDGWTYAVLGVLLGMICMNIIVMTWELDVLRLYMGGAAGGVTCFCWWHYARKQHVQGGEKITPPVD